MTDRENLFQPSLRACGMIEHSANQILKTLNLFSPGLTLCLSSDKNKTVNDFITDLMNFDKQS